MLELTPIQGFGEPKKGGRRCGARHARGGWRWHEAKCEAQEGRDFGNGGWLKEADWFIELVYCLNCWVPGLGCFWSYRSFLWICSEAFGFSVAVFFRLDTRPERQR